MNNLLLLFDSLSVEKLGCYGANGSTPSVNTLAANGDLYTFCYADQAGQELEKFVANYKSHTFAAVEELLGFDLLAAFHESEVQTQVLRFGKDFDVAAIDQVVESILLKVGEVAGFECNTVLTALHGLVEGASSSEGFSQLSEIAAHVPLIVSIAQQNHSRRRSTLLATPQIVQLIESLFHANERYTLLRDSLETLQLQYSTEKAIATRTEDWLLIREREVDEHGEHVQALFRKPEDVWEILDVAEQYPQVLEHFAATGDLTFPDES